MDLTQSKIAVLGLGYVGLPLAVEFGKHREVLGFDPNRTRIEQLRQGQDRTREVEAEELVAARHLNLTDDPNDLKTCDVFIIAVPTPIDSARQPDLSMLLAASWTVGAAMRSGAVVIYESTVYPGCTREACVPVLEEVSGLKLNTDFYVGYSPERVNPGDKQHRLTTITKVTSGSTAEAADAIDALYKSIVTAGTFKAASIEVAEAAKVIENTQRDVNIALMNELAIIFHKLDIDTTEVLEAAGTKWNFLPFRPGLVGGHCIGVDPYYLTHKAQQIGYHPDVVLSGRRINDSVGERIADRVVRMMMKRGFPVVGSRVLVMGLTFKENCPDLRNTRVVDVVRALGDLNAKVDVWDPWVDGEEALEEHGIEVLNGHLPEKGVYDAMVLAVSHSKFIDLGADTVRGFGKPDAVFFDVKSAFDRSQSDARL